MTNMDDDDENYESVFDDPFKWRILTKHAQNRSNGEPRLTSLIDTNNHLNAELMSLVEQNDRLEEFRSSFSSKSPMDSRLRSIIAYYEEQLRLKNKEINRFRAELDAMLEILKSIEKSY